MRATERLSVTVARPIAAAARQAAEHQGESLSALTDRALRDYLIRYAARVEPSADREWLDAVAEAIEATDR